MQIFYFIFVKRVIISFQQNYVLRTAMVKDGDQENFAAIIVQRNHPDLDSILETFDETISYFKDKP